jgi:hypothetical protein
VGKDFSAIRAFFEDGKYLNSKASISTVIAVATEELGKVGSRHRLVVSSCMVPPKTAFELVEGM